MISHVRLTLGACTIKLFTSVIDSEGLAREACIKLEGLSLQGPYTLV